MFFKAIVSNLIDYFTNTNEESPIRNGLSDRMTNLVRNYNNHRIHCYKPFVLSLNSRKMLDYINKVTSVNEKLKFYSEYNKLLVEVGKILYEKFDPTCIYTFNNEIHLVYYYDNNGNYILNGNIHKLLTRISSYASVKMNSILSKNNIEIENFYFDGNIVEFSEDYETFNFLIWRQFDCMRNTLNSLYRCYKIDENNNDVLKSTKLNVIKNELFENDSISSLITNDILYGILLKKEIYYKENETDKNEMVTRKKIVEVSHDFTNDFTKNMQNYIINKKL